MTNDNKALWLAVVCAVAAFGLLNTVFGSQTQERTGTVTITQVLDDDMGSMVVEAARPTDLRVASDKHGASKRGAKAASALELAVGL
jgi:hypothetical protein